MTWTVTTDPHTRQQTLLINIGKLGGTDKSQGITWDMAKGLSLIHIFYDVYKETGGFDVTGYFSRH